MPLARYLNGRLTRQLMFATTVGPPTTLTLQRFSVVCRERSHTVKRTEAGVRAAGWCQRPAAVVAKKAACVTVGTGQLC